MSQILSSTTAERETTSDSGRKSKSEVVTSVTFVDDKGAVHTLTFLPEGTDVAGEEEASPRIVGEHIPSHTFKDAREAVTAYERGEIN